MLADINGHSVTVRDFERSYVQFLIRSGVNDTPEARYTHLEQLIEDHLWYGEALRRNLDSDSLLSELKELAFKSAMGGRFYEIEFLNQLPPLEETEIRQAFARYKQPVIARHLFFRNETDARTAHVRLEDGHSFLDEAQRSFNTESFDSTAGWLGEIRYFQVDDAIAEAAFELEVGRFSSPIKSRAGWHIIQVVDRIQTPILSESEFQNRKSGISSLLRVRKRRLEGDYFIRSFMEERNVQVIPEGVRSLHSALGRLTGSSITLDTNFDTPPLTLTPTTPLATFTMNEASHTFTGKDYFFWFPDLPVSEATSNPAASLGRAIRNEALAMAASDLGLGNDEVVREEVEISTRAYLAHSVKSLETDSSFVDALRSIASIRVDSTRFHEIMVD